MHNANRRLDSAISPLALAFALAVAVAIAYVLLWSLLNGSTGCGPPGHSASGRIFSTAPFVLPLAAASIVLAVVVKRRCRGRTLALAALITIAAGGLFEVLVYLLEFSAHHCGE